MPELVLNTFLTLEDPTDEEVVRRAGLSEA
jgi:hypothetical protein